MSARARVLLRSPTWQLLDSPIVEADCVAALRALPESSVDAIVTDPPYGLEFMGQEWDRLGATTEVFRESLDAAGEVAYHGKGNAPFGGGGQRVRYGASARSMQSWHERWAREALRVLRPGGHCLAFGGARTSHRLACALEDVGFEIRDSIMWLYGSGFPKSLDVSKAIDAAAGAEREVVGTKLGLPGYSLTDGKPSGVAMEGNVDGSLRNGAAECAITAPATPDAERWQGWGTALAPSHEPIVVARKPLAGTVAQNVLAFGTGALNIDACRVEGAVPQTVHGVSSRQGEVYGKFRDEPEASIVHPAGRWPKNVVLSHSPSCRPLGTARIASNGHWPASRPAGSAVAGASGHGGQDGLEERNAAGEEVQAWDCAPGGWRAVPAYAYGGLLAVTFAQQVSLLRLLQGDLRRRGSHIVDTGTSGQGEGACDPPRREPLGSPADYRSCHRCGDAHARMAQAVARGSAPQLADALEPVLDLLHSRLCSPTYQHGDHPPSSGAGPAGCEELGTRGHKTCGSSAPQVAESPSRSADTGESELPARRRNTSLSNTDVADFDEPSTPCRSACTCEALPRLAAIGLSASAWFLPIVETVQEVYGADCPVRLLDEQAGTLQSGREAAGGHRRNADKFRTAYGEFAGTEREHGALYGDAGGASRFFPTFAPTTDPWTAPRFRYQAKASSAERNAGLDGLEAHFAPTMGDGIGGREHNADTATPKLNMHPTVKPVELMRWLVRLITPPGGVMLDPFCGSGSTGCAAALEGFEFVGIERQGPEYVKAHPGADDYAAIARARIAWWTAHPEGMALVERLAAEREHKARADAGQLDLFDA